MAAIPSILPTLNPSTNAGDTYTRVQASPAAFGGQIGQATQFLGQQMEHGADVLATRAIALQGLQNETVAKERDIEFSRALSDLQFNPQKGFSTLQGRAAVDGYQSIQDQAQALYKTHREGLNPEATRMFDAAATRRLDYSMQSMAHHAATQNQIWMKQTDEARIDNEINTGSLWFNDEKRFSQSLATINSEVQSMVDREGASPERAQELRTKYVSAAWQARLLRMGVNDPTGALNLLKQHANDIDPRVSATMQEHLQGKADTAWATGVVSGTGSGAPLPDAIHNIESGGRATSATSVDGARGGWQIMPATFQQYARPGENIDNPADNEKVGRRIVDDLSARFGGDPARVAVGYFSGPGNVAPPGSPTPWKADKTDGNGQTVSGYVNKVLARMGAPSDQQINETAPSPRAAEMALQRRERMLAIQAKERHDVSEQAADGYLKQILKDPMKVDQDALIADEKLSPTQREHLVGMLRTATAGTMDRRDTQTYGTQFWGLYLRAHLPDDDPNKLTDPSQLYQYAGPGGGLTVAGVDKLSTEIMGKRTAEGEAESAMRKSFLTAARDQITGSREGTFFHDPKGDELFQRFQVQFWTAYDAGRKAGKSPAAMLDTEGPDSLWKLATGFKRTLAQRTADMTAAMGDGAAPKSPPAATETAPRVFNGPDDVIAAYQRGEFGYGVDANKRAFQEVERFGIKPPPTPADTKPQVPTSEGGARELPKIGELPGKLFLNPGIAPRVAEGAPRPFAPGEYMTNPDGSWSSEITTTINAGDEPKLNGGRATIVPTLWIVNGKPTRVDEDTAAQYAIKSGLRFRSYNSNAEAEKESQRREAGWQKIRPQDAGKVPALWEAN